MRQSNTFNMALEIHIIPRLLVLLRLSCIRHHTASYLLTVHHRQNVNPQAKSSHCLALFSAEARAVNFSALGASSFNMYNSTSFAIASVFSEHGEGINTPVSRTPSRILYSGTDSPLPAWS